MSTDIVFFQKIFITTSPWRAFCFDPHHNSYENSHFCFYNPGFWASQPFPGNHTLHICISWLVRFVNRLKATLASIADRSWKGRNVLFVQDTWQFKPMTSRTKYIFSCILAFAGLCTKGQFVIKFNSKLHFDMRHGNDIYYCNTKLFPHKY